MVRQITAAFVVFHLLAVVVLSLPHRANSSIPVERTLSRVVLAVRAPFEPYGKLLGARQGWRMFGGVSTELARFEVDQRIDGRWQPLYRPQSPEHDWQARLLRQERIRAAIDAFQDQKYRARYRRLAEHLADRARAEGLPGDRLRVRMQGVRIPPPDRIGELEALVEVGAFWSEEFEL